MQKERILPLLFGVMLFVSVSSLSKQSLKSQSDNPMAPTSSMETEVCHLCGSNPNSAIFSHLKQDNLGLLCINTFDLFPIEINSYDENGQIIEDIHGALRLDVCMLGHTKIFASVNKDIGYSQIILHPSNSEVNPDALGSYLCKSCLSRFTSSYSDQDTPFEIALINFSTGQICPLARSHSFFRLGHYFIFCTFKNDREIILQIVYQPVRYP